MKRERIRLFVTGGTFDKEYDELTGTLSFNQNQQGTIDLNFNNQNVGFTLANEGSRPVYVAPTSIVPTTGTIGASASRKVADFSRVLAGPREMIEAGVPRGPINTFDGGIAFASRPAPRSHRRPRIE